MAKKKYTKLDSEFTYDDLNSKLSGLTANSGYFFTKRNNFEEFTNLMSLVPKGYAEDLKDSIESIDLIYSASTGTPFIITLAVGRNDTYQGKETFDVDIINIGPDSGRAASYYMHQWHHFKDWNGNRTSYEIHPCTLSDEELKKNITYGSFLTGSTAYFTMEEYEAQRQHFYSMHVKSFGDMN